mmetsp:Transcript_22977/g.45924  ORF Transcript_22977/g.45924 Transcript_22977/m.45924 type:complete len:273 (+) Transcript_22977:607-1425(+)
MRGNVMTIRLSLNKELSRCSIHHDMTGNLAPGMTRDIPCSRRTMLSEGIVPFLLYFISNSSFVRKSLNQVHPQLSRLSIFCFNVAYPMNKFHDCSMPIVVAFRVPIDEYAHCWIESNFLVKTDFRMLIAVDFCDQDRSHEVYCLLILFVGILIVSNSFLFHKCINNAHGCISYNFPQCFPCRSKVVAIRAVTRVKLHKEKWKFSQSILECFFIQAYGVFAILMQIINCLKHRWIPQFDIILVPISLLVSLQNTIIANGKFTNVPSYIFLEPN